MDVREILDAVAEQSATVIQRRDGDYEVDGMLYCGKCHTPKQTTVDLMGDVTVVNCLCECMERELSEEEERERSGEKIRLAARLRREGFPDDGLSRCVFSNDDQSNKKLSTAARRYVELFDKMRADGKGLLLFGKAGTGKTFIAACIANALIDKGIPCMVTNFPRLTNTLFGMKEGIQDYIDGLNRYDLLVIDDLSAERRTEYVSELVQMVIDERSRSRKPLIVTTNLTAEELKNPKEIKNQRLYSRLLGMCYPIEVKGVDRRKEELRGRRNEMEELLGL